MACCKAEIEGLYDCLILSYLGVAHQVYCLLTTGNIELGSLITLMLLVQLHKIKNGLGSVARDGTLRRDHYNCVISWTK